jgi:hypothetical protein
LQLSSLKNYFNDLFFSFIGEELIKIGLFGKSSMRDILIDLFHLQNFRQIFFDSISPVESLVSVAGYLEVFVIDFVSNGGHIRHFDVGGWLIQHNSFIIC